MIIIVEGVDRVGKTSLCEQIIEAANKNEGIELKRFRDDTRYYKYTHDDRKLNTEKANTLTNLIENKMVDNIIIDRFHLTEYIYGLADRAYINNAMVDIDDRLSKLDNVLLIYVQPQDIDWSSEQHGSCLRFHDSMMAGFYNYSKIKMKIKCEFNFFSQVTSKVVHLLKEEQIKKEEKENETK